MSDPFTREPQPPTAWEIAHAHDVLGTPETASIEEIDHAARRLVRRFHPDRPDGSAARFVEVISAEALLLKECLRGGGRLTVREAVRLIARRDGFLRVATRYYPRPTSAPPARPPVSLIRVVHIEPTENAWACLGADGITRRIPRSGTFPRQQAVDVDGVKLWFPKTLGEKVET